MSLGPVVLLVFGIVMILGGLMGHRAGSKVSLISGSVSGLVLLGAWFISRDHMAAGLWIGVGVSALLSVVFGMRLAKTGKFMPTGGLLVVSVVALVLLVYSVFVSGDRL